MLHHHQDGPWLARQAQHDKPDPEAWPALGASSKEGSRDSGIQSNRQGWPGMVREGAKRFLVWHDKRRNGEAVGGGSAPQETAGDSLKRRRRWRICIGSPFGAHRCVVEPRGCCLNDWLLFNFPEQPRRTAVRPLPALHEGADGFGP